MSPLLASDQAKLATAINTLSSFLANEQIAGASDVDAFLQSLPPHEATGSLPTDVIVVCASAVLSIAESVFSALTQNTTTGIPNAEKIAL